MLLARVKGSVVSTHKAEKIQGLKLLLLETINPTTMEGKGSYVVAMDAVGAGIGEVVFYATGSSARQTAVTEGKPTDTSVIAIVDNIEMDGQYVYQKNELT
ncbi:ethanolamine utilization protein EutN [candidate division KSB3 bacterium]|uniref:Ethanolamine utilization protein EutN n=1 Tax=candidate division KSB3 bacterium TaxID=2044937 RepID=A0A2G6KEU1_9BACT|nr:MAG: ethanolamine utilization protein EutN [candidate division KSB3 bacterium]